MLKKMIFFNGHRSPPPPPLGLSLKVFYRHLLGELILLSCTYGKQNEVSCAMQIQSVHETRLQFHSLNERIRRHS